MNFDSLTSDPALQAQALELWNTNRTGPYVQSVPINHIAWTRLPDDSPAIKRLGDPSSGRNSAHIEFILGVSDPTNCINNQSSRLFIGSCWDVRRRYHPGQP